MRYIAALFVTVFFVNPVFGQDSTVVVHSVASDTLVNQRFIDRYENVFMTKVPTRHMFKVGLSQYYQTVPFALYNDKVLSNTSLNMAYEYKIGPSYSLAISSQFPFLGSEVPINYTWQYATFDAQFRWFFDMKKKIRLGKSANNFSGNYLAANFTYMGTRRDMPTTGVKLGFQRRFLNNGFMDFAVAVQRTGVFYVETEWSLSSQASFGFAFGDWKRTAKPPLCDILLCDEHISRQWKITIPDITLGLALNRIRQGIGFERKLGASSFSLNFQYDLAALSGLSDLDFAADKNRPFLNSYYSYATSRELLQAVSFQPRYYFLKNRQKLKGTGGNGLSGIYTGVHSEYSFYLGRHRIRNGGPQFARDFQRSSVRAGILAGFQQRVFDHGYLDLNASYNLQRNLITSENTGALRANLGIGFAF